MHSPQQGLVSDIAAPAPSVPLDEITPAGNGAVGMAGRLDFRDSLFAGHHFSKAMRLHRLFRHGRKLVIVPLDHSVSDGPIARRGASLDQLVGNMAASGVDGVVLHKGSLRHVRHTHFGTMSLIVHLSASSCHATDPDAKYLVTGVEEAVALGADAVSVHVNLGSLDERTQIADLGAVAGSCDKWNVPLIAMVYPRGPHITNPGDPELVAHAAILAADLGADIVKTVYPGSSADMAEVASACPIPVIVAGGPRVASAGQVLGFVSDALLGGASGVAMGRNIFMAPDPCVMAGRITGLVREFATAESGALREGA